MSHLEQELLGVLNEIKHISNIMNKYNNYSYKKMKEDELLRLIAKRNIIENKITEAMLLDL